MLAPGAASNIRFPGQSGHLSPPRTTSGNIYDEVRQVSAEQQAGLGVGSADGQANPCLGTDVFGIRCNSRRRGLAEDDGVIEAFPAN